MRTWMRFGHEQPSPTFKTASDLMLAGWHNIWSEGNGSRWVHINCDIMLPFVDALRILKKRGVDCYGDMK